LRLRSTAAPQRRKFAAQFIEYSFEPRARRSIGRFDFPRLAERFHDQIDRAILQMQATSVWQ
jgi:hypothetical protein